MYQKNITLNLTSVKLAGKLTVPEDGQGMVIFSHGNGKSSTNPRNSYIAGVLNSNNIATFLFGLLTEAEDDDFEARYTIDLLTSRLIVSTCLIRKLELGHYPFQQVA
jgi:putative phosphoribosyl transferase